MSETLFEKINRLTDEKFTQGKIVAAESAKLSEICRQLDEATVRFYVRHKEYEFAARFERDWNKRLKLDERSKARPSI